MISTAAFAADLPPPPPPVYQPPPPPSSSQQSSGWYLRGDVGVGVQNFKTFDHPRRSRVRLAGELAIDQKDIQDTAIFGFGVGYELNNWLRFDVTGEYRTKAKFKAIGSYTEFCSGGGTASTSTTATIRPRCSWPTPISISAPGGASRRTSAPASAAPTTASPASPTSAIISDGTDGFGFTSTDSAAWNMAWNVQAGLTYNVTNNFKVDFSWRYLNSGSPQRGVGASVRTRPACPARLLHAQQT